MWIYATKADLARYMTGDPDATEDQAPADALKQIQSASILIRRATSHDIYAVDADGYPTASRISDALRDATCAMAAAYSRLSLDLQTGAAGFGPVVVSKSLGSAAVSYAQGSAQDAARAALADGSTLTSEAYAILRSANLMGAAVYSDGAAVGAYSAHGWVIQ